MKKKDVKVGASYVAKVSGKLARVRIERESPYGGWEATNVDTGRRVRIKSPQRLRYPARPTRLPDGQEHGSRRGAPQSALTLEESAALERKRDDMFVVIPSAAQRQADAEAGSPGATEYAESSAAEQAEVAEPEYENPDVCGTPGCGHESVITYIGKPLCQACWQAENRDSNDEEPKMATTKKSTKAKKGGKAKAAKRNRRTTPDTPAGHGLTAFRNQRAVDKAQEQAAKPKRVSALDAAATVLKKAGKPMRAQEMIVAMAEQGLWQSPAGKTPHATLYAAILREIGNKGGEARFRKTDRGQFEYAG